MRRLFQFGRRREAAIAAPAAQSFELEGAQLAWSSSSPGAGNDCLWLRVSSLRTVFALLEPGGRGEQRREMLLSAQAAIDSAAHELLSGDAMNEADAMIELCSRLNHALLQTSKRIFSCTAFCGCYNQHLGTICYFNAGHIPALLHHNETVTELQATGLPLGLFSHSTPDAPTVALPAGGTLLVTSRRLVHAKKRGDHFGFPRLKRTLESRSGVSAEGLCATIAAELQEFVGNQRLHEMSLLALTRQAHAVAAAG